MSSRYRESIVFTYYKKKIEKRKQNKQEWLLKITKLNSYRNIVA